MPELSIIVPTCQRSALLEQCLAAIERGTRCDYELIIVDGASTDATPDVLNRSRHRVGDRLKVITEDHRQGFTKAINQGFRAATGRYVTWLNDDARPMSGTLDQAVQQMSQASAQVGLLALFHAWHGTRNVAYETRIAGQVYRLLHVRGTLFASFGLGRRETFANLGYFDERYFTKDADADFSLKVWHAGLRVEPAYLTAIDHDEVADARRGADLQRGMEDDELLLARWNLPGKNSAHNDFDPTRPCTLAGKSDQPAVAI